MTELNEFELLLLKTIIKDHLSKFSFLLEHLDFIGIDNRKITDGGLYLNFTYFKEFQENDEFVNGLLSAKHKLTIPSLKNELTYCLDITNGKMDFLEVLTNGKEIWDGDLTNATLTLE